MSPSRPTPARRARSRRLALPLAALAGLAAPAAAAAAPADVPGQIPITVTCGAETLQATSGLGGFAAWITETGGKRVVLRPIAVAGTISDAEGAFLRPFSQTHTRNEPGSTTSCSFTFVMGEGDGAVTLDGSGAFLVGPR
jgi:hypothetical protein